MGVSRRGRKVKGVREPSKEENSRDLEEVATRRRFYVMAEAMTRKAKATRRHGLKGYGSGKCNGEGNCNGKPKVKGCRVPR
jgi:hypothetical protein